MRTPYELLFSGCRFNVFDGNHMSIGTHDRKSAIMHARYAARRTRESENDPRDNRNIVVLENTGNGVKVILRILID